MILVRLAATLIYGGAYAIATVQCWWRDRTAWLAAVDPRPFPED
jgi:hypothetical protein